MATSSKTTAKKPARQPVSGLNIHEALTDAGIFIASQGFVGAFRMLLQGALADGVRKVVGKIDDPISDDALSAVLKLVKDHIAAVYPAADKSRVERAMESYLLKSVEIYGNASLTPEVKKLQLDANKSNLAQELRNIQASHTTFQTRVYEMLPPPARAAAIVFFSAIIPAQRDRWAANQERVESPDAFADALAVADPAALLHTTEDPDGRIAWREMVLVTIENMTAKPKAATVKGMFEQIAEFMKAPTLSALIATPKPLPDRKTKESDDDYRKRLIADGHLKEDEDFAARVRTDRRQKASNHTLAIIDAEGDAVLRLARGEQLK